MVQTQTGRSAMTWSGIRGVAAAVGVVFIVVGILGFIPGITTDYDTLGAVGPDSHAKLIGLFEVSVLHNIVHLAFGVAGLLMSRTALAARAYLIGGGVIYLVLWVYGLVVDRGSSANFVPMNTADNWLHLVLGLGMIGLGVILGRGVAAATDRRSFDAGAPPPG